MKHLLKLILGTSIALTQHSAIANVYRIDFTYGADLSATDSGSLDGFMVIDTTDTDYASQSQADTTGYSPIPNWVIDIQLDYDPTPGNPSNGDEVRGNLGDFDSMYWDLTNPGTFDVTANFVGQFDQFGFGTPFPQSFVGGGMKQQYVFGGAQSEFLLTETESTPGELPILGLATLLFYFKKLKNKKFSL